jgi:hypothetical protein
LIKLARDVNRETDRIEANTHWYLQQQIADCQFPDHPRGAIYPLPEDKEGIGFVVEL